MSDTTNKTATTATFTYTPSRGKFDIENDKGVAIREFLSTNANSKLTALINEYGSTAKVTVTIELENVEEEEEEDDDHEHHYICDACGQCNC